MSYNKTWDKDRKKDYRLKKRYGITLEQFNSMLKAQGGECAVCKVLFEHRRINTDHDHKTKRVRGLLCYYCNSMRVAGNTPETARAVFEYLKRERALGL